MKKIILASKSIDRSKIFNRLNISFEILNTNINESDYKDRYSDPFHLVKELAKAKVLKAKELLKSEEIGTVIIAADTIVEFNGKIIGKAQDEEEAFQILKSLVNRSHNLITGIALTGVGDSKIIVAQACNCQRRVEPQYFGLIFIQFNHSLQVHQFQQTFAGQVIVFQPVLY